MISRICKGMILLFLFGLSACAQPLYHWGEYEDSLYLRATDTSHEAQEKGLKMLELTISEAEENKSRVAPGVYADYGYLLFKQGQTKKAILNFKKEAELYPESRYLMDSMISRIRDREKQ